MYLALCVFLIEADRFAQQLSILSLVFALLGKMYICGFSLKWNKDKVGGFCVRFSVNMWVNGLYFLSQFPCLGNLWSDSLSVFILLHKNIHKNIHCCSLHTINSLVFARDLFGEICDHLQIAKINTCKYNSCTSIINKTWAYCKY